MSPPLILDKSSIRKPRYRPTVPASAEICQHCLIYLDEGIYNSALALLTDLVTPGASHPSHLTTPVFAPLPFHIEIISILLVHPNYTTQAPRGERELATRCITFLRNLLSIIGPLNSNLGDAFSLTPPADRRRGRYGADDGSSDSDDDETQKAKGVVANQGRIRTCAKDFWHIVGWAFNCSVVHHKRWKYWKIWLDYMLDVLDADWNERKAQDEEDEAYQTKLKEDPEAQCDYEKLRNCLLLRYLSDVKGRSTALKRVVGAIFTDGGADDLKKYPQVFPNETEKPPNGQKRKRAETLDGSTLDDNDPEVQAFSSSQSTDAAPPSSQATDDGEVTPDLWLGGPESLIIRQRVMILLSRAAAYMREHFVSVKELYGIFSDNLNGVPLPAFSFIVSPANSSPLPVVMFVSLTQLILLRLLPNTPRPHTQGDEISQEVLERCFLPFAASNSATDDNAKVSIVVENMLRALVKCGGVQYTSALAATIEKGILARETKIKGDKRRKEKGKSKTEEEDRVWLTASSRRMRSLLAWLEDSKEVE